MLTTGIGSLPFSDPDIALEHVFRHYSMPFCPQLPQITPGLADAIPQMLDEILTSQMRHALRTRNPPRFLASLEAALSHSESATQQWLSQPCFSGFRSRSANHKQIKLQLIGPLIAHTICEHFLGQSVSSDQLFMLLLTWIERLSVALLGLLCLDTRQRVILVWDDGNLPLLTSSSRRRQYLEVHQAIASGTVLPGIHSCHIQDLATFTQMFPHAILALDITVIRIEDSNNANAIVHHLQHGGEFILGLIDTSRSSIDPTETLYRARMLCDLCDRQVCMRPWRHQISLSGGCGTGLRDIQFEQSLVRVLAQAAALFDPKIT